MAKNPIKTPIMDMGVPKPPKPPKQSTSKLAMKSPKFAKRKG